MTLGSLLAACGDDGGAASTPVPSARVYAHPPYQPGRDQTNASDAIFDESLLLSLREQGDGILGTISFDVRA